MAEKRNPVLRFAPSPTGYLHIGGARTALFNWLYARHSGGKFLLRIEDTDRERSTPEAVAAIFNGLAWMGLDWDEEPIFQFARAGRHREVAEQMLAKGQAYRCYATPQELDQMRAEQKAKGVSVRYDGRWRNREPGPEQHNMPYVVRLKAPQSGETIVHDVVQGTVRWSNDQLDDMVLLRSDGNPTYMLAVVVDDFDMGVTHVIRGADHLNNAARQLQIIEAMGWPVPVYGHLPLIHGADGAKLSKRHGALAVEAYRDMGYLPETMRNYLLRLGWSHGDDEIIPTEKAIEWFNLDSIGRSAARFDMKKLDSVNAHYIRDMSDGALADEAIAFAGRLKPGLVFDAILHARLVAAMPLLKPRARTLVELLEKADFLFTSGAPPADAAATAALTEQARMLLSRLALKLDADPWDAASLETRTRVFAEKEGVKLGDIAQPLRAALTGRTASPPIFDVAAVLGREEALTRIRAQGD
ncbi:MAG TPA: glutamate--tRNA ligase [Micropepsaceae bacterium]|jgi:glutamyl-tRNA synthetase|nr:glutamate--tRNA ligase [Micropepsaceae bacterium]